MAIGAYRNVPFLMVDPSFPERQVSMRLLDGMVSLRSAHGSVLQFRWISHPSVHNG